MSIAVRGLIITLVVAVSFGCSSNVSSSDVSTTETPGARASVLDFAIDFWRVASGARDSHCSGSADLVPILGILATFRRH